MSGEQPGQKEKKEGSRDSMQEFREVKRALKEERRALIRVEDSDTGMEYYLAVAVAEEHPQKREMTEEEEEKDQPMNKSSIYFYSFNSTSRGTYKYNNHFKYGL